MAGHSKWANIKHKKERADAQKGKIFSRMAKEIISAVKVGGPDPKSNPRLRLAIQKAKTANMPVENIERNIKKAAGSDKEDFVELIYEMYGHGGVGLVIEILTDNKNRTASDMRIATHKRGGTIAEPGSVLFNFERKGVIQVEKESADEATLFQVVLEAGAEDLEVAQEGYMITTDPSELYAIKERLDEKGIAVSEADIEMIPTNLVECDKKMSEANLALIAWLEELDDVRAVYHNMDL